MITEKHQQLNLYLENCFLYLVSYKHFIEGNIQIKNVIYLIWESASIFL